MAYIKELNEGDEFYFPGNRSEIFVVLGFQLRPDKSIKKVKCFKQGKLYPQYFTHNHEVYVLQTPVLNIKP